MTSGYRSKFEEAIAKILSDNEVDFKYEDRKLKYTVPSQDRKYTPDFTLPSGILVECKGYFTSEDRQKMLQVRRDNPDEDIRLVFQNARVKINKNSKTTYADWAIANNFIWSHKVIPPEWY